jgi:hypothetical protein
MDGTPNPALNRRTFLKVTGVGGAALAFSSAPRAAYAATTKRAYVIVIDGCRPGEVDSMPNVAALRDAGTWYPAARSLPVMETIPNHVMMMTGCRPARNGVPANSIYDRTDKVVRDCSRPTDIRVATIIEQLNASGRTTGTVLSKEYLYSVFGTRATHRWEPFPLLPITEHAPDAATMEAALTMVKQFDPAMMFVNLGDVDRVGHADITGTTLKAARNAALQSTNAQIGRFVDLLKSNGTWASSMVIVLADHSMDWSLPQDTVSLSKLFDADASLKGSYQIAQNGGADLVYWTGPSSGRSAALSKMTALARGALGVFQVHRIDQEPALRLDAKAGDLLVYCEAGWRFSDPGPTSNPIPGNHGHPATEPIPFIVAGGSPVVRKGIARSAKAHTMDVAPTLGAYFGLKAPSTGWEGTSRL